MNLPVERPVETAAGVLATTPLVLLDLRTDSGVIGRTYVRCYAPEALHPLADLVRNMCALVLDRPVEPATVVAGLQQHFRLLGLQGLAAIAIAAIDMAVWDALAISEGLSLAAILGGEPRPIRAYASLRSMNAAVAAMEAEHAALLGFTAVKVKVGGGTLDDDLNVLRAIRSSVGPEVALMVDYNQSLSVDEALLRMTALDQEGLRWVEEPTCADDFAGHARIAEAARTPIQLGENCWGAQAIQNSISVRASDEIMFDVMKIGGVTGWLRAGKIAVDAHLSVSSHAFPELSAQLLSVTPTCGWLEYVDHAGPILEEPVRVDDGFVLTSSSAGSGVSWDEEKLKRISSYEQTCVRVPPR